MNNPTIHIEMRPLFWMTEVLAFLIVLANTGLVLVNYAGLPETIPIHFTATGEPDAYDDKSMLLFMAVAAILLCFILTFLGRLPRLFQYPFKVTEENAKRQYENAAIGLRLINIVVALMFGYTSYATIAISQETMDSLGAWFLPTTVAVLMIISTVFIYRAYKRQ